MKRTTKRLVLDARTIRTLTNLADDQLRAVRGGFEGPSKCDRTTCQGSLRNCAE